MHIADPSIQDIRLQTPLHFAAYEGHLEICRLLIENIDNKNPANHDGETPFDFAKEVKNTEIMDLFKNLQL